MSAKQDKDTDKQGHTTIVQQMTAPEDAVLSQLMEEQSSREFPSPETMPALSAEMLELHKSMFELPDYCKDKLSQYAFCWCELDPKMLRIYQRDGWQIANRTKCPFIPSREFHVSGAVERHGASRHVLLHMPRWMRERMDQVEQARTSDRHRGLKKEGDPNVYMQQLGEDRDVSPVGGYSVGTSVGMDGSVARGPNAAELQEANLEGFDFVSDD